jgi:hypothetical protein
VVVVIITGRVGRLLPFLDDLPALELAEESADEQTRHVKGG